MELLIFALILIGTPMIALVFFLKELISYLITHKENTLLRARQRRNLIIWGIVLGVSVILLIALFVFFSMAISYM